MTGLVLDWVDPAIVFESLYATAEESFWIDAGVEASAGWSYLGDLGRDGVYAVGDPARNRVFLHRPVTGQVSSINGSMLDLLSSRSYTSSASSATGQTSPFTSGSVGWIGYESGVDGLGLSISKTVGSDSCLLFPDRIIAFDHARRRIFLSSLRLTSTDLGPEEWMLEIRARVKTLIEHTDLPEQHRTEPNQRNEKSPSPASWRHNRNTYRDLIRQCMEHIRKGEAYQLCLTNSVSVETSDAPLEIYRRLRNNNPTPRGGFFTAGGTSVLSSSPETFLAADSTGHVRTSPIKGTRPRSKDFEEDQQLKAELRTDPKELAENVMIVDLVRNDLSKVARLGSVEVTELFTVESYRNVHQLVSTVKAELNPGSTAVDAIRSLFPAGSMTGAPKASAIDILHRLERGPRGPYAGTHGYIDRFGAVELNMTIRSIIIDKGIATIGTGGGITALSDPDRELDETILKAAPLLLSLGAAEKQWLD